MQIVFLTNLNDSSDTSTKPNFYNADDYLNGIGLGGIVLGTSTHHAVIWQNENPSLLWTNGSALGANESGEVVGDQLSGDSEQAVTWRNGQLTLLPSAGQGSSASTVNDLGIVAGYATEANGVVEAAIWQNGQVTYLGTLPGDDFSDARAINDAGQVVGTSASNTFLNGFIWQNGQMTALATITGDVAVPVAINNHGVIAGYVTPAATIAEGGAVAEQAVIWTGRQIAVLPVLQGDNFSTAEGVNDVGIVVGYCGIYNGLALTEQNHAVVWQNGQIIDLNTLLPANSGWVLEQAYGISDANQVVGQATYEGNPANFILTLGTGTPEIGSSASLALTVSATGETVVDGASDVTASLDYLQGAVASGKVTAIDLTDSSIPTLSITFKQLGADSAALGDISSNYHLAIAGVTVATMATTVGQAHVASVAVVDSAADVTASLDSLQAIAATGKLSSIALTDSGIPTITVTALQSVNDTVALEAISSDFVLSVTTGGGGIVDGVPGRGTIVSVSVDAAVYDVSGSGENVILDPSNTSTIPIAPPTLLINVTAVQFSDFTEIIAPTPGSGGTVTGGNITELYGAALGREPDVAGLVYYEAYLTANPNTPLLQFSEWFLASPEYTGNSAHDYAQTVAGDEQFITDSYSNLLHRMPSAAEVSFYETNVIAPMLTGLTAGTAAYLAADTAAHAQTLVYFSASPEFLSDVQVTATNPANAQHWLVLV